MKRRDLLRHLRQPSCRLMREVGRHFNTNGCFMERKSHPQIYDTIGRGYRQCRVPDRRIGDQITAALGDAQTVCNVGAGSGSYEPTDRDVTALEPSQTMIQQRTSTCPVVCASAEHLPFADSSFDASMAILTIHHWIDPRKGLEEMRRVSRRQVVFTFDPAMVETLWLVRDYLPEIIAFDRQRTVSLHAIVAILNPVRVETVAIPWDCTDGFQGAYWRRPAAYLKSDVRVAISSLSQLPAQTVSQAMQRLSQDLRSGTWQRRYAHLLDAEMLDLGYRLLVSEAPVV
jgi:SAM-dependent methyltransferase